jgi:hypothetical protein
MWLTRFRPARDNPVLTKPLARRTLRVRYSLHHGLPQRPESTVASVL